jgi:hypothetical protein
MRLVCEPSVCAGGAPPPTPILLATSDRTCVSAVGGRARNRAWRGAERVRGSLVAPVRRERPWARFHKHNHPPKRSHCHIRPTLESRPLRPGPGRGGRAPTRPGRRRRARARTAAKPLLGAPAPGPTTRRREHPRRSSAGNTLTTYVTARLSTPMRLQNLNDERARERARTGPRG